MTSAASDDAGASRTVGPRSRSGGRKRPSMTAMLRIAYLGMGVGTAVDVAAAQDRSPGLVMTESFRGAAPIPVAERGVPTVTAAPWRKVIDGGTPLEGVAFDRDGALLLCDVAAGRVLRFEASGSPSALVDRPGLGPGGLALDADRGILVAAAGDGKAGSIGVVSARRYRTLLPPGRGFVPNDVVPDGAGGFYFTDFRGSAVDPKGGVLHVAADGRTTPLVTGLALPNGLALSPDRRTMWVAEHGRNRLLRIALEDATHVAPLGLDVAYNFIGPKPDTVRVDARGRVYVALNGQGRILVLSEVGIPIGQVLLPGRNEGRALRTTSMAIRPGTDELWIVSSDGPGSGGGWVYRARAFPQD
jgi:lactonase